MDQSERDLERDIQALLTEASLGQWVETLNTEKASGLLLRLNECTAKANVTGFRLGEMQLQWAADLIEKRLRESQAGDSEHST